jgi:peptidoglycan/LPS O-acetylase OafA/YrhL
MPTCWKSGHRLDQVVLDRKLEATTICQFYKIFETAPMNKLPLNLKGAISRPSHLPVIDLIRGLAALSVVLLHAREILWVGMRSFLQHDPLLSVASFLSVLSFPLIWGSIGVPVFFVLSGYVIHRRSAQMLAKGADLDFSAGSFLLRRFIRIYPTFVVALLLTLVCDTISQEFAPHHNKLGDTGIEALGWNLAALQGVFSRSYGSNGALWTLAIEIQFYAFYPLALLLRKRIGMLPMLIATFSFSVFGYFVFEASGLQAFPAYYLSWWLGAYVADREAEKLQPPRGWPIWAALLISSGCALILFRLSPYGAHTLWSAGFALILAAIIGKGPTPNRWWGRFPTFVGKFSYSLYAVHMPLAVLISAVVYQGVKQQSIYVPILWTALFIVLAYGFYFVSERPFVRLLKRMKLARLNRTASQGLAGGTF